MSCSGDQYHELSEFAPTKQRELHVLMYTLPLVTKKHGQHALEGDYLPPVYYLGLFIRLAAS